MVCVRAFLLGFLRWLKKRKVTVVVLIFTFIVSGFLVNLVQLFTLPLYWINKTLFRKLNARIVYFHWCILPWVLESWAEYDIQVFGIEADILGYTNKEHALCLLNHRGDLDWMIGWVISDRLGVLGGMKAIMKDIAKYLPGIGWTFLFMEYPFLKRDWAKDQARLKKSCQNLSDYPVNMLLCLFAEGTRFTPEKHKLSVEYSEKNNLPILRHHLFPRTKGFCYLVNHLKDSFGALYDITICYRGTRNPSIVDVINAEPCSADLYMRRFAMADVVKDNPDDASLTKWLIGIFKEKDDLVEYHNKHKRFPGPQVHLPKRPWSDMVVLMWVSVCSVPVFMTTLYLVLSGNWFMLGILIGALILADLLFQFIIRETQTNITSSSYGLQPVSKNGVGLSKSNSDYSGSLTDVSNSSKKAD